MEFGDLEMAQAWIRDLLAVGYRFPELQLGKIMPTEKNVGSAKSEL